jgi:arginase family enzyme
MAHTDARARGLAGRIQWRDVAAASCRTTWLLGAPTSMASFAPGQEKAPRALRDAGIVEALTSAGVEVEDHGDLPLRRWAPDHT